MRADRFEIDADRFESFQGMCAVAIAEILVNANVARPDLARRETRDDKRDMSRTGHRGIGAVIRGRFRASNAMIVNQAATNPQDRK
jgi:hypothetical protein